MFVLYFTVLLLITDFTLTHGTTTELPTTIDNDYTNTSITNLTSVKYSKDNSTSQPLLSTIHQEKISTEENNASLDFIKNSTNSSTNKYKKDEQKINTTPMSIASTTNSENSTLQPFATTPQKSPTKEPQPSIKRKAFADESTTFMSSTTEEYTTTPEPTTTTEKPCEMPEITITHVSPTEISFNWTETETAENYSVEIFNLGPNYTFPIDSNCLADNTNLTEQFVSNNYYNFTQAKPYYQYEIKVTAICPENKNSETASESLTTKSSQPEPPANFRVLSNGKEFEWDAPCYINGESLSKFEIEFNGSYTEDENLRDFTTEQVEVTENFHYTYSPTDEQIKPSYNYKVILKVYGEGSDEPASAETNFTSPPGLPAAPILSVVDKLETEGIKIQWTEPEEKRGKILEYTITIEANGPKYANSNCRGPENITTLKVVDGLTTSYEFKKTLPYSQYTVTVTARTSAGSGDASSPLSATTAPGTSRQVENIQYREDYKQSDAYESHAVITFDPPCDSKGPLNGYIVTYTGKRPGYPDHEHPQENFLTNEYTFSLKPDYSYTFSIKTNTEHPSNTTEESFHSTPGFPQVLLDINAPEANETSRAYFNLSKDRFDETNGIIKYYAIVLLQGEKTNVTYEKKDYYNESSWPVIEGHGHGHECDEYQITPNFWNPFQDGRSHVTWVIGGKNNKLNVNSSCVRELNAGTTYKVYVRVLTSHTWIDTKPSTFTTRQEKASNAGLAVGLTIGILAIVGVGGYVVYFIKFKKKRIEEIKARESNLTPAPITCKRFMDNYDIMQQYDTLKTQFVSIGVKSKEFNLEATSAVLTENKRKNRYINILPFDETRVKLKIEEDDDLGSDYINASYIKGYTGKVEYIATQGPLQHTCKDFWKMVVQENVTIIAMVSQFIEQNKEKCFQYFPNNGQSETYADNLQVRCVSELHFGTFCVRTLQVTKDNADYNVTHMQFLEWPDFGVPDGTNCMLEYCCQIRERAKSEGGLIVVHCSAGVGRTGTLIATDILLQTIQDHRDINVFKTVLEMRKQRMNMVQTEKQYIFIHSCLKDALEDPVSPISVNIDEPLYQNVEDMGYFPKPGITPSEMTDVAGEQESAF